MSQEQNKDMSQYFYRASAADFMKIPSAPLAYWASEKVFDIFQEIKRLSSTHMPRQGLATTDNARFVRYWYEISISQIGFHMESRAQAEESKLKWFPMDKGGGFRKWYGNNLSVVNWQKDGLEIKTNIIRKYPYLNGNPDFVAKNPNDYFKPGTTWGKITSSSFSCRFTESGYIFSDAGSKIPTESYEDAYITTAYLNSCTTSHFLKMLSPTMNFEQGDIARLPFITAPYSVAQKIIKIARSDWDSKDISWDFLIHPLIDNAQDQISIYNDYSDLATSWLSKTLESKNLEEENNRIFIEAYGLQNELIPDVPLEQITLSCNPHYRYGGNRSVEELETLLQCDTLRELVSYAIGCMMGRYSLDKPGLILASQGETLQDYLRQIPSPRFAPDTDAILPLTDQEWFADDATNRFCEFIRVVWGEETLQENLDFVAESLCLHAIKAKRGESALDTIRRYLSTQFFKDHLRTYKKRPIYWLFSSGKHKAFECLVYLHRYNAGTLARMRTEYVIPLSARLNSYAEKLEQAKEAAGSTAETKRLEKELTTLHNQQAELAEFDEKLRHYADQRISLDLDDGVKVNYGKFGDLLAEVKSITGESPS